MQQIRDLMTQNVITITPDESAELAARLLSRHNVGALPVCSSDGKLHGIITDRDIVLRCVAAEIPAKNVPVGEIMTRSVETASPDDSLALATQKMAKHQIRRLPVVENGRCIGMLSLGDLAKSGQFDMEASKALSEISSNIRKMK